MNASNAIQVRIRLRESYGNLRCYPVTTDSGLSPAECLARIANTKTLSSHTLAMAETMGLRIIVVDDDGSRDWRNAV